MADEKHKSQRSTSRLLGQFIDANGAVAGVPLEVRHAYPNIHTKRTKSAAGEVMDKPRYDDNLLVPKLSNDPAQCPNYKLLSDHCMEAATKAWGSWPQGGKWPIQDGDVPHAQKLKPGQVPLTAEQIAERNKWRKGHWIVEVTNYNDPGPRVCVLQNGNFVEVPAKSVNGQAMYKSGDYGYVFLCAYTFHNKTFGVNFGFEGVLFTRPGEAIGSSGPRSASQMFGSVAGMAAGPGPVVPGAAAPGPQTYAPPVAPAQIPTAAPPTPMAPPPVAAPAPQYTAPPAPAGMPPLPGAAPAPAMAGLPPIPGR